MEQKIGMQAEGLCEGLPREFTTYLRYVKSLHDGEKPDYAMLREVFRKLAEEEGIEYDFVFDWTVRLWLEKQVVDG